MGLHWPVSRATHCSFCPHSLILAPGLSLLFLLMALDSCRNQLQSWGLTWEAAVTAEGRDPGMEQWSEFTHTIQSQELCPPRPLLPCLHLPFRSLSWTPRTEGGALHGLCGGWVGKLVSVERRSKASRGRHSPCGPSRIVKAPVRLYPMSFPEQPNTRKSIPFSTFSAE